MRYWLGAGVALLSIGVAAGMWWFLVHYMVTLPYSPQPRVIQVEPIAPAPFAPFTWGS